MTRLRTKPWATWLALPNASCHKSSSCATLRAFACASSLAVHSEVGSAEQKAKAAIETAAQGVLDARAQFQQGEQPASLADLYDPLAMPPALLKAHQKLDAAVDAAYALTAGGKKAYKTDAERVAFLFELYQLIAYRKTQVEAKNKKTNLTNFTKLSNHLRITRPAWLMWASFYLGIP